MMKMNDNKFHDQLFAFCFLHSVQTDSALEWFSGSSKTHLINGHRERAAAEIKV